VPLPRIEFFPYQTEEGTFSMMRMPVVSLSWMVVLTGCAGVSVQALKPEGVSAKTEPGIRYYRPEPYLLVAALPPAGLTVTSSQPPPAVDLTHPNPNAPPAHPAHSPNSCHNASHQNQSAPAPGDGVVWTNSGGDNAPGAGAVPDKKTDTSDTSTKPGDKASPSSAAPAATADVGFSAATPQYSMKLIYLPDYSHPLAITMHSGLFGTASVAPALQDGWMLTSLQGSADNKAAETLTALGSIVGAALGTGNAGGAAKSKAETPGAPPSANPQATVSDPIGEIIATSKVILEPGLYRFQYGSDGRLSGFCAVVYFNNGGAVAGSGDCTDKSPAEKGE
jgi:hypothetical protein